MTNKATNLGIITMLAVLLIAMAFAGAASAAVPAKEPYYDKSANTFIINETGHLVWMANNVGSYGKKNYTLDGDIDCGGNTLNIIGTESSSFSGIIEGNYKEISNFSILTNLNKVHVALFGHYRGTRIANLTISNFSVLGGQDVGGLVGTVNSKSTFENVCVKFGTVHGSRFVGGLIGYSGDSIILKNCTGECCVVASTTKQDIVGGLVGYAASASMFDCCKVANSSISGHNDVGGLVGTANSAIYSPFMNESLVTNCILSAGDSNIGGLVGRAGYTKTKSPTTNGITGSVVENCTLVSTDNLHVGGMVGFTFATSVFNTGNWVNKSAVRGNGDIGEVVGWDTNLTKHTDIGDYLSTQVSSDGSIWLNNNTYDGYQHIFVAKSAESEKQGPELSEYFNENIFADTVPAGATLITQLTGYGRDGKYAALTYAAYSITNDTTIVNGTISADRFIASVGDTITVTAMPKCGYHLNWTYWHNESDSALKHDITSSFQFIMPAKNVKVSGDFKGNVTNVTFYNLTVPIESKLNVYKESTNTTPSVPTRIGYTFAGWNISSEDGTPFNSTEFNESGIWNFTGSHYTGGSEGVMSVYANWTANTYTVHFDANGGQGSMADMTFTYDKGQNLTANAFQCYNSNFLYWTCNGTKYNNTAFVQNLTPNQGEIVEMIAQWETYSPRSSKQTGYTVILPGTVDTSETMCTVNFAMNGHGIQIVNRSVTLGNTTDEPYPVPTADGYTFTGWYIDRGLTSPYVFSTPVTDNIDLYAGWTAKDAKIPTSKSPAPFLGILASLGAAAVLLRLRK